MIIDVFNYKTVTRYRIYPRDSYRVVKILLPNVVFPMLKPVENGTLKACLIDLINGLNSEYLSDKQQKQFALIVNLMKICYD